MIDSISGLGEGRFLNDIIARVELVYSGYDEDIGQVQCV